MRSNEVLGFKEVRGDCGFSLKPKPKGRPVKMDTSFKLNVLWQVSSFACTKSHHIYCRNCSVIVEGLCLSNSSLLF